MNDMRYFGKYAICKPLDNNRGAQLMGADNIVGTTYSVSFSKNKEPVSAYAVNPYGTTIGYFDKHTSNMLNVINARGWKIHAILSLVGFTNHSKPLSNKDNYYWAEFALVCVAPRFEPFLDPYLKHLSQALRNGVRPDINLISSSIDLFIQNKGNWQPSGKTRNPGNDKDTIILKRDQSLFEKAVEQGRARNKGCYAISLLFLAATILLLLLLVRFLLNVPLL